MTSSATTRGGRHVTWTREKITAALQRYAELFGADDMTTASFNPSLGKWRDRPDLVDRYVAGDPETGAAWPSVNAIKKEFGSFNAAREAAGFEANARGPKPGFRRADGAHAPDRAVRHVTRVVTVHRDGVPAGELAAAERRAVKAEARADRLEREVRTLRRRKPKTQTKTKVKVVREKDLASLTAAKAQAKEARTAATRLAARLERAEATINTLRAERADLKARLLTESQRAFRAQERARALEGDVREVEVVREVERVVERVVELPAPSQATVDAALRDAMLARREAAGALRRAERADASYRELAVAVKGEARRLTAVELAELRAAGPSGPAVLAAALRDLAGARAGRGDLGVALARVASAAVGWKDRI